jgi:protoporphyrinogen oxidase
VADPETQVSLTLMLGGSTRTEQGSASDAELAAYARADLEAILGLAPQANIETVIRRWSHAVPQYNEALRISWDAARAGWCSRPGRVLFGNYTGQVSIRGMVESVTVLEGLSG